MWDFLAFVELVHTGGDDALAALEPGRDFDRVICVAGYHDPAQLDRIVRTNDPDRWFSSFWNNAVSGIAQRFARRRPGEPDRCAHAEDHLGSMLSMVTRAHRSASVDRPWLRFPAASPW